MIKTHSSAPAFAPSGYQQVIFDWILRGRGDAFVDAVAGSGKTTTLVQAANLVSGRALFLAFNKHIANELSGRLPRHVQCKTIHSLGLTTVSRHLRTQELKAEVFDRKLHQLARHAVSAAGVFDTNGAKAGALVEIAAKAQVTLADPTDTLAILNLIGHFEIDLQGLDLNWIPGAVADLLAESEAFARERGEITYTDMIWLPHRWNLPTETFDWVFVDEAQDLSAAQLDLAMKARRPGGRILFVGDRRQAIYGFAGADNRSVDAIIERTGATELPLSICYRCPSSHLDLARVIVPQIEARPDAPAGEIAHVERWKLPEQIQEGDVILCRTTAPLVSLCFELIRQKVPARIKGRDIGRQLAAVARKAAELIPPAFPWANGFLEGLAAWEARELDQLKRKEGTEMQQEAVRDKRAAVREMYAASAAHTTDQLVAFIDTLFADERSSVTLSTVHRAKGLEADRVWILRPDLLPFPKATGWQLEQEMNLKYVALTRAKSFLGFVADRDKA